MAHDLRLLLRLPHGGPTPQCRHPRQPHAPVHARERRRAGFDGHKKRKGSKVHAAVDTLGHLLALKVTPANEQDRAQVADLTRALQAVSGEQVEVAFVDQGYTGEKPAADAAQAGVRLEVVKHHEAKRGFCVVCRGVGGGALLCLGRTFPAPGP